MQIIITSLKYKIIGKIQITQIMTYFVHKNQVELKSTVLQRFNSKFSEVIHIRIERQVATNKNIMSKTFLDRLNELDVFFQI